MPKSLRSNACLILSHSPACSAALSGPCCCCSVRHTSRVLVSLPHCFCSVPLTCTTWHLLLLLQCPPHLHRALCCSSPLCLLCSTHLQTLLHHLVPAAAAAAAVFAAPPQCSCRSLTVFPLSPLTCTHCCTAWPLLLLLLPLQCSPHLHSADKHLHSLLHPGACCCCCCSVSSTSTVLVGDPDQLAPIGPGRPCAALLAAGLWPSIDLKQIYRTGAGSSIIRAAHAVNKGAVWGLAKGI
jgi:hypothetical protein